MDYVVPILVVLAFVLIGPILGTVAFFRIRTLRREFDAFKAQFGALPDVGQNALARAAAERAAKPPADSQITETSAPEAEDFIPQPQKDSGHTVEEPEHAEAASTASAPADTAQDRNFEEIFGAKWAVWIGGIALALGGVFLVRYSIEQGLLGPGARVLLGALFAIAMAGAGEWTRRAGNQWSFSRFESANIPSILTAVGTLAAFATIFAAYALYGFLSPFIAFAGLTIVTLLTMAAALLHGPLLAGFGILASFLVPFLVATDTPSTIGLAGYALAVSISAFGVARLKYWRWMAIVAALGMVFWGMVLLFSAEDGYRAVVAAYAVISWAIICFVFVISLYDRSVNALTSPDHAAWPLLSLALLPLLGLTPDHADTLNVVILVLMLGAPMWVAREWTASRYVAPIAIVIVALGYSGWDIALESLTEWRLPPAPDAAPAIDMLPGFQQKLLSTYALLGAGLGLLAVLLGMRGSLVSTARIPVAIGGAFLPVLVVAVAYARMEALQISFRFGLLAIVLSVALFGLADTLKRRLHSDAHGREGAIAVWLIASLSAFTLGLCMMLDRGALTVALGLMALIVAVVYVRYPLVSLRVVSILAAALWAARVAWDPAIVGDDLGATPVFNWLLLGYGAPAAGFVATAYLMGLRGRDVWLEIMEAIATLAVTVTLALLGLHAIDPDSLFTAIDTLAEAAMLAVIGGGMALALLRLPRTAASITLQRLSEILGGVGMAIAGLGLLFVYNPLITGEWIGRSLFFNVLLFAYLLTALLYGALGFFSLGRRHPYYSRSAVALSGVLFFAWISLTIRHGFHPGRLTVGETGDAELYMYSAAWLLIGIVTLLAGFATGVRYLRIISGIIIVAVIAKVFLFDMAALTGFLRALSFIGLGVVLVGIGLVYQRLLRQAE